MAEEIKFHSPQEEIAYLERKILERKQELAREEINNEEMKSVARRVIDEHVPLDTTVPAVKEPTAPIQRDELESAIVPFVDMVFEKGPTSAIQEVRKTHNPHVIDAFHDALRDHLLESLKAKGLIKIHD